MRNVASFCASTLHQEWSKDCGISWFTVRGWHHSLILVPCFSKVCRKLNISKLFLIEFPHSLQLKKVNALLWPVDWSWLDLSHKVYTMLIHKWPRELLHKLNMFSKNFICCCDGQKKSLITCQWKTICKPLNEGGLGLRLLDEFNKVGLIKSAWDFVNKEKRWTLFPHVRFLRNGRALNYYRSSYIWHGLKHVLATLEFDLACCVCENSQCKFWYDDWSFNGPLTTKGLILPDLLGMRDNKLCQYAKTGVLCLSMELQGYLNSLDI